MSEPLHWGALISPRASWAHLAVCPESEVDDFVATLPEGARIVVRLLRGARCGGKGGLFQEWAAALQFPYYFGANWDAFEECLTDLTWLPGEAYVFLLTRADRVLARDEEGFGTFVGILDTAAQAWADAGTSADAAEAQPVPFRVVFHAEPEAEASLRGRLGAAGVSLK